MSQPTGGRGAMRPRARLLHTLGQDLISGEKVAVIELVKNAYDADASVVVVRFRDSLLQGQGALEIWDDGHGMSADTVTSAFLEVATRHRRESRRSERKGRRVLGEKGIGRLAAGRLGQLMHLTTRRENSPEIDLMLDWSDFADDDRFLDEIEIAWSAGPPGDFAAAGTAEDVFGSAGAQMWEGGHGTALRLERLTTTWDAGTLLELRTALSRLITPQPADRAAVQSDFSIILDLPHADDDLFDRLAGPVDPPDELTRSNYTLRGSMAADGRAELTYAELDGPTESFQTVLTNALRKVPRCGPIDFELRVWDRDRESISRLFPDSRLAEARENLDRVAGVSLYRDGFRVFPYGEQGDDWLHLDNRRIQNPTQRISNNQILGYVFIGADQNPQLRDQSNREGIIEGPAYDDLRAVLREAITQLETRRYLARRPAQPRDRKRGGLFERFDLSPVSKAVSARHPEDGTLRQIVADTATEVREGVDQVQEVLSRFSRLATMSQLVDSIVHDGRTAVVQIMNVSRFVGRDAAKAPDDTHRVHLYEKAFDDIKVQVDVLRTLFRRIEPFGGRRRGRPRATNLTAIVTDAVDVLRRDAEERGVSITVHGEATSVTVDVAEIHTVVVNLVQNALYWVTKEPTPGLPPQIVVDVQRVADDRVDITVSDSGPGVSEEASEAIFDPYFSTREDGVGLGLANVGHVVGEYYGGSLELLPEGPLPGATFRATLRRRV